MSERPPAGTCHHFLAASWGVGAVSPSCLAFRSNRASMLFVGRSTSAKAGSEATSTVCTLLSMPPRGTQEMPPSSLSTSRSHFWYSSSVLISNTRSESFRESFMQPPDGQWTPRTPLPPAAGELLHSGHVRKPPTHPHRSADRSTPSGARRQGSRSSRGIALRGVRRLEAGFQPRASRSAGTLEPLLIPPGRAELGHEESWPPP